MCGPRHPGPVGRLLALFLLSLSACNAADEAPYAVASLRESMPKLEQVATQWRPDAYFVDADVELLGDQQYRSSVSAYFESPTTDFEGILVYLEQDGSTTSELVPYETQLEHAQPIALDEWDMDATEALDSGLTSEGRQYLEDNPDNQCSFMTLERESQDRVVWRIELGGCLLDPPFHSIVIDANTGELLRVRSYPAGDS